MMLEVVWLPVGNVVDMAENASGSLVVLEFPWKIQELLVKVTGGG